MVWVSRNRKRSLARSIRASDVRPKGVSTNVNDLEESVDDTSNTFTSDETSRNTEAIDLEADRAFPQPKVSNTGTDSHGNGVLCLREQEAKTQNHHVWHELCGLDVALSVQPVSGDNDNDTNDGENNGEYSGRGGDGEGWVGHSDGNSAPSRDRWCKEVARVREFEVDDAWVGFGEEDKDGRGKPDADERADTLGVPLNSRWGPKQETDLEVIDEIARLRRSTCSDGSGHQIVKLSLLHTDTLTFGDTAHDELRSLRNRSDRRDICGSGALNGEEGEK